MHAHVHPVAQCLEPRLLLAAQQVADLNLRPADSYPAEVTDVGGTAYFAATNNGVGRELYKTDGTPGGTALVKDVNPGPEGSDPSSLINVNGTLFFIATFAYNDKQLWKSDGTAAGTVRVSDNVNLSIPTYGGGDPNTVAYYLSYLTQGAPFVVNTFHARDGGVQESWTTDLGQLSYGESKPVWVLTSSRTFSGGEELAYGLQAMRRARVVGEVTGGGANLVHPVPLGEGFVARMPSAP